MFGSMPRIAAPCGFAAAAPVWKARQPQVRQELHSAALWAAESLAPVREGRLPAAMMELSVAPTRPAASTCSAADKFVRAPRPPEAALVPAASPGCSADSAAEQGAPALR